MSWSAWLTDDRGHAEGHWNFTHNCNGMVHAVLADAGVVLPDSTHACSRPIDGEWRHFPNGYGTISWWEHLDGMTGPDGAAFLHLIIRGLTVDPARFRAMNPPLTGGATTTAWSRCSPTCATGFPNGPRLGAPMASKRPRHSWREVAIELGLRMRYHDGCLTHPEDNPDPLCAFCKDRRAYAMFTKRCAQEQQP